MASGKDRRSGEDGGDGCRHLGGVGADNIGTGDGARQRIVTFHSAVHLSTVDGARGRWDRAVDGPGSDIAWSPGDVTPPGDPASSRRGVAAICAPQGPLLRTCARHGSCSIVAVHSAAADGPRPCERAAARWPGKRPHASGGRIQAPGSPRRQTFSGDPRPPAPRSAAAGRAPRHSRLATNSTAPPAGRPHHSAPRLHHFASPATRTWPGAPGLHPTHSPRSSLDAAEDGSCFRMCGDRGRHRVRRPRARARARRGAPPRGARPLIEITFRAGAV